MRYTPLLFDSDRLHTAQPGFTFPRGIGADQRESLCRGIAFFVVLALSCLLVVYAPLVWGEPDWTAAGVRQAPAASSLSMSDRIRVVPMR